MKEEEKESRNTEREEDIREGHIKFFYRDGKRIDRDERKKSKGGKYPDQVHFCLSQMKKKHSKEKKSTPGKKRECR